MPDPTKKDTKYVILYVDKVVPGKLSPTEAAAQKAKLKTAMVDAAEVNAGQSIVAQLQANHQITMTVLDPTLLQLMSVPKGSATQPGPAVPAPK